MSKIYHVSKQGKDTNLGDENSPLLTINKAASIAKAGDTVIVHEGVYRECVIPQNGGFNESSRITYTAAKSEKVIIKGSEIVKDWKLYQGNVWQLTVDNSMFHGYNPFSQTVEGDWFLYPDEYKIHSGELYLNGKSFYEATSLQEVLAGETRTEINVKLTEDRSLKKSLFFPQESKFLWHAIVEENTTTVYANFHEYNPNKELTEINVRKSCFKPDSTGVDFITVQNFEMAHAATMWSPPTADQTGLISTNWSKSWIIENNIIHDSKCSAISIGKESSTGNNERTKYGKVSGYHKQLEAVYKGLEQGWCKEKIGSHIIRNNTIYDCGQNGIVGHLGCVFSEIYGNHIFNIGAKMEYFGWEIAGIKLHTPIDVEIHGNYIHNCQMGLWMDWQAQGTRISKNVFNDNLLDAMVEVSHGPYIVDNNLFLSKVNFCNVSQGGAYVHNIFCGKYELGEALDRSTPYHLPHSTKIKGASPIYGGDDRVFNNVFYANDDENVTYGTSGYDNFTSSVDEYIDSVSSLGKGDLEAFLLVKQPVYMDGNVYYNGSKSANVENTPCVINEKVSNPKVTIEEDNVYLNIECSAEQFTAQTQLISSEIFEPTRLSNAVFEDKNGRNISFDRDLLCQKIEKSALVGAIQSLKTGENKILLFKLNEIGAKK